MDEKTEELRDIFMDVSDEEAVTERQQETRGSLMDDEDVRERIEEIVGQLRERYEFRTALDDDELCELVDGVYAERSDDELADALDVSPRTVFRARMDLHLLRDEDTDAPFDLSELKTRLDDGSTATECADAFGVSEETIERYRLAVEARDESRQASHRFRDEFDAALGDGDIATQLTEEMAEDGLDDATEGMETDVSF